MWRKTTKVGSVEGQSAGMGLPCGCVGILSLLTELVLEPICAPLKDICRIVEGDVPVQVIEYIGPGGHDVWSPLLSIYMYKGGVEPWRNEAGRSPVSGGLIHPGTLL